VLKTQGVSEDHSGYCIGEWQKHGIESSTDRYSGRVSLNALLLLYEEGEEEEDEEEGRVQKECEDTDTVLMWKVEERKPGRKGLVSGEERKTTMR
jgi:hypothetical protein